MTPVNHAIIMAGASLLAGLLFFEKREHSRGLMATKAALSGLFVFCAAVQPHPIQTYFLFVLSGLFCCLAGDILLALPGDRPFLLGLIAFLLGHIGYVAAFVHLSEISRWAFVGAVATIAVSGCIYLWLRPHLGQMHLPVVFYIMVISCMLSGAWALLGTSAVTPRFKVLVFAGALCFYTSDLFVARDRFLGNAFINRMVGLPLYYTGQFMIAFSVGVVSP